MEVLFVFLLVLVGLSWGVAALASSRGRSGVGFFLLSLLLSPLIGLIVVLIMSDLNKAAADQARRAAEEAKNEQYRRQDHERQIESIRAIAKPARPYGGASADGVSLADELRKLAQLRDEGLITSDEFNAQKAILLGGGSAPPANQEAAKVTSMSTEFGICPNCNSTIPLLSNDCPNCSATFGLGSRWKVTRIQR